MKVAIISDIHANLPALEACLGAIDREGADLIVCLGDLVGYAASPNACTELVRRRAAHVVLGNHDAAVVGRTAAEYFNDDARAAVAWTRGELTEDNFAYLHDLPLTVAIEPGIRLVHSAPTAPARWDYLFLPEDANGEFAAFGERLCFVGHTHLPRFFIQRNGTTAAAAPPAIELAAGVRAIVNVGSVGQPRDGDPRAGFVMYDSERSLLEMRRVTYDIRRAQDGVLDRGLPRSAAERLTWGV